MRLLIVGGGEVGLRIARDFVDAHDVVVVDADEERTVRNVHAFTLTDILLFVLDALFVPANGAAGTRSISTAASAVAATLGNVGPGVGAVGPMANSLLFPATTRLVLAVFMVLGRLEILTVLVLFTDAFWRIWIPFARACASLY